MAKPTTEEYALALVQLTDAFLMWHGCFPADRTNKREIAMNDAMTEAYRLIGQPGTTERIEKLNEAQ